MSFEINWVKVDFSVADRNEIRRLSILNIEIRYSLSEI